jgi:hypothetical protein
MEREGATESERPTRLEFPSNASYLGPILSCLSGTNLAAL